MDSLFERIENMGVKVGTVYLDREFFNTKVISKVNERKLGFVIAAKSGSVEILILMQIICTTFLFMLYTISLIFISLT